MKWRRDNQGGRDHVGSRVVRGIEQVSSDHPALTR